MRAHIICPCMNVCIIMRFEELGGEVMRGVHLRRGVNGNECVDSLLRCRQPSVVV
jgi:hypothetical protein